MNTHHEITEHDLSHGLEVIKNGGTLSMLQGISTDDLEAIYSVAHSFYGQGDYDKAQKLFCYLCLYQHMDKRFWKGLAACYQMQKNYKKAAESYAYMALLDIDDPEPSFHASYCFIEMKDFDAARTSLDAAIHQAKGRKKYQSLLTQAQQMLHHISDEQKRSNGKKRKK